MTPERLQALCRAARLPAPDPAAATSISATLSALDALPHGPPPPDPRALRAREDLPLARPCLHGAPSLEDGWLVCRGLTLRSPR